MNSLDPKKSLINIQNDGFTTNMTSSCPKLVAQSNHVYHTLSVKLHLVSVKLCVWAMYVVRTSWWQVNFATQAILERWLCNLIKRARKNTMIDIHVEN